MRALVTASSYCGGVAVGLGVGPWAGPWLAPWTLAAGVAVAVLAWSSAHRAAIALALAAALLGVTRGSMCGPAIVGSELRGPPRVSAVVVRAPSEPGAWCEVPLVGGATLLTLDEHCPRAPGDRLIVPAAARRGDLGPSLPDREPGWAISRSFSEHVSLATRGSTGYLAWVAEQRQQAWRLSRGDASLALVVASALGLRVALASEDRDALREAGLGHLIAVSGLNVGVAALWIYALVLRVAWLLGRTPTTAVVLSWVPVLAYVALTGAAPSAVRAATMLVLVGLGVASGRPAHGLCALALAGAAMLCFEPRWAIDPGFQLSVAAMAAVVSTPPGTGIVAQSWRVSWAVAPVSWWHFEQASLAGLLGNVIAIPVFSLWVLPASILGWLARPWVGELALAPARAGAQLILDLSRVLASSPTMPVSGLGALAIAGLAAALLAATRTRAGHWLRRRGLVPPALASLGMLVVLFVPTRSADSGAPHWYAVGGERSTSLIVPAIGSRAVCIHDPHGGPGMWLALLDGLAIAEVQAVIAPESEPGALALSAALAERGRLVSDPLAVCGPPDRDRARRELRRCLRRRGEARGIVRGRTDDGRVDCYAAGDWRPAANMRVPHG